MRAAHITQPGAPDESIEIVDVETPEPGPNEVRIRVEACALNHADIFARKGHPEHEEEFPKRTGLDISGVIDETGSDVSAWSSGDEVVVYPAQCCLECESCMNGEHTMCLAYGTLAEQVIGESSDGGFAEYVVVPAWNVERKAESLDFVTAAAWPATFTTAWRLIVSGGELRPSESALVLGASGGVGNAALQIADRLGATVYGTVSTEEKAAVASKWAEEVIDYTETDFAEEIAKLTDGRGVDLVVDHVGQETWQQSVHSLARGGRMVLCGATTGPNAEVDIRSVYQYFRQIVGAPLGNRQDFRDVGRLVAKGELQPHIDRTLPLDGVAEGHRLIEERENIGKIVITPQE